MDLQRHSCILPSSAPALPENAFQDLIIPSRVLQERSGNGRYDQADPDTRCFRKHLRYFPIGDYSPSDISSYTNSTNIASPFRDPREIESEFTKLWRYLHRSEQYKKYRARQTKDSEGEDQIWPEFTEIAFWRALVQFRPMGRQKRVYPPDPKPRGRNELVADAIEKATGETRTRKQVSSHIQVLKGFLKDHPKIMKYLSTEDMSNRHRHSRILDRHSFRRRSTMYSTHPQPQYTVYEQPPEIGWDTGEPITGLSGSYFSNPPWIGNRLKPVDFEMFVRVKRENDPEPKRPTHLHTYTKFDKDPRRDDLHLQNIQQWQELVPESMSLAPEVGLDCETIICEASLEINTITLPKGAELAIQLEISYEPDFSTYDFFDCQTTFHGCGVVHDGGSKNFKYDLESGRFETVPFASEFWAKKMWCIAKQLRERSPNGTRQMRPEDHDKDTKLRSAEDILVDCSLDRLSAVQEINARRRGELTTKRLLVIFWRFSQAAASEKGKATWRNLIYPQAAVKALDLVPKGPHDHSTSMSLELSSASLPATSQHQHTFDTDTFELDTLSDMALASIPSELTAPSMTTGLSQDNSVDFTAGHINICMEHAVSLEGYPDASTHFAVDPLQQFGRQWSYGELFEHEAYPGHHYMESLAQQEKEEGAVSQADILHDPLAELRSEGVF